MNNAACVSHVNMLNVYSQLNLRLLWCYEWLGNMRIAAQVLAGCSTCTATHFHKMEVLPEKCSAGAACCAHVLQVHCAPLVWLMCLGGHLGALYHTPPTLGPLGNFWAAAQHIYIINGII